MNAARRRARNMARMQSVLASLETRCTNCTDGTVPNIEATAAWKQQMDALRPDYIPSNPHCGGSVRYYAALNECPPEQITCPACSGSGVMLTAAGQFVVAFLARHGIGGAR